MHPIDEKIWNGEYPEAVAIDTLASVVPGVSYYVDRRREGRDHRAAVYLAARDMGAVLRSVPR